jgi:hypothetical protein
MLLWNIAIKYGMTLTDQLRWRQIINPELNNTEIIGNFKKYGL